ncbi:hypothetical protein PanWU01x14_308940, partial [Parasponia andersonii]
TLSLSLVLTRSAEGEEEAAATSHNRPPEQPTGGAPPCHAKLMLTSCHRRCQRRGSVPSRISRSRSLFDP